MQLRDNRLDSLKGFLIILVILGHLIGQIGYGNGDLNWEVRTFIYTFHMPLFILISGYFTKIEVGKILFVKGLMKLAIPLVVFQIISMLFVYIYLGGQFLYSMFLVPYWTLWYLLSLIFWRIMLYFSPKGMLNNPLHYIALAFSLSVISGFIPYGNILSIQRTFAFYPFFLLGYYIHQGKIKSKLWRWSDLVSYIIMIIIVLFILLGLYPKNCRELLSGSGSYDYSQVVEKIYMLFLSTVASISVFNIICENKILTNIGKDSLLYYLYHGLIIKFAVIPLLNCFDLPKSFPFILLYSAIIIVLIYYIGKFGFFRQLVYPFNYQRNKL